MKPLPFTVRLKPALPTEALFGLSELIVGAGFTCTVTVKVFTVTWPAASRAVTVTVVTPSANTDPDACEYASDVTPTASVAVAAPAAGGGGGGGALDLWSLAAMIAFGYARRRRA